MHYVRYSRAAVASGVATKAAGKPHPDSDERPQPELPESVVLWASVAFPVRDGGRVVGVRRRSTSDVAVGWLAPGSRSVQWVSAADLLTEEEARQWLRRARFTRQ